MKINARLHGLPIERESPTFPALYRAKKNGQVVLFSAPKTGTVVIRDRGLGIGHHSENWVSCLDTSVWEPLQPGYSVVLDVEKGA